jgi:hypothetical protein
MKQLVVSVNKSRKQSELVLILVLSCLVLDLLGKVCVGPGLDDPACLKRYFQIVGIPE